jgi:hypothetical protein
MIDGETTSWRKSSASAVSRARRSPASKQWRFIDSVASLCMAVGPSQYESTKREPEYKLIFI